MPPPPPAENPPIRAVLFDATGTLIELARPVGEVYAEAARAQGVDVPSWRIEDAFARVIARAAPRVFPELEGLDEIAVAERAWWGDLVRQTFQAVDSTLRFEDPGALKTELFEAFARPDAWRLRDGAVDLLDALEAFGLRSGVVSNFDLRLVALLDALGIGSRLACCVLPAHCGAHKPDAAIFLAALDALGLPAEAVAFVGDDPSRDLAGARAVGMRAIDVGTLARLADLPRMLLGPATVST